MRGKPRAQRPGQPSCEEITPNASQSAPTMLRTTNGRLRLAMVPRRTVSNADVAQGNQGEEPERNDDVPSRDPDSGPECPHGGEYPTGLGPRNLLRGIK